jgi:glutamine synthetase
MDVTAREDRKARAEQLVDALAADGVVAVATTFTDNAGITRVKSVPLARLPQLAAWGAGTTPSFDLFTFNDSIAAAPDGSTPVGDLRIMPDLDRVVRLAAQPGWAWIPGERYEQSGEPHAGCGRLLLRRLVDDLAAQGITMSAAVEVEWVVSVAGTDDFVPAALGPAYSLARLGDVSDYARELLEALTAQGVEVEQFHPEYAAGQLEVSVAAEDPLAAADTSILVRDTIRAVGRRHGMRTSFSPKVDISGVGNGGHVHVSLWRDGLNLMAGGDAEFGLTAEGASFTAGLLEHLPALMAIGAPSVASYLRLVPSHWAGAYSCWGLENREAALRMVTGSAGSDAWAANVEVKCFDLLANPYLVLAGIIAVGSAGMAAGTELPAPVEVDPAVLSEEELQSRGIDRLPQSLQTSTVLFEADDVLAEAFGSDLRGSILAVRHAEMEHFAAATEEEVAAALRWTH